MPVSFSTSFRLHTTYFPTLNFARRWTHSGLLLRSRTPGFLICPFTHIHTHTHSHTRTHKKGTKIDTNQYRHQNYSINVVWEFLDIWLQKLKPYCQTSTSTTLDYIPSHMLGSYYNLKLTFSLFHPFNGCSVVAYKLFFQNSWWIVNSSCYTVLLNIISATHMYVFMTGSHDTYMWVAESWMKLSSSWMNFPRSHALSLSIMGNALRRVC